LGDEAIEHVGHVVGGDGAFDLNDQALFGEDVSVVEQLELLAPAIAPLVAASSSPLGVGAGCSYPTSHWAWRRS
jgi:hypothetical protein